MTKTERLLAILGELARFGSVGLVATGAHSVIYLVALTELTPQAANIAGYLCAVLISYFGHGRITFRQGTAIKGATDFRFLRFVTVSLLGLMLNAGFVHLAVNILKAPAWTGVVFISFLTPVCTYILLKRWVFDRQ
jgi:putative flippase GtrA